MPSIWFIECDLYDSRRRQTESANSLPIQREIYVRNNNSKQGHHQRKVIVLKIHTRIYVHNKK